MSIKLQLISFLPTRLIKSVRAHRVLAPIAELIFRSDRKSIQVIPRGVARGLRFRTFSSRIDYILGTTDPGVQEVCRRLVQPGMVVYDIGANVGFFTMIFARLIGSKGRVYAFEPLPSNTYCLKANATVNGFTQVTVVETTVGSECGQAEFWQTEDPRCGHLAECSLRRECDLRLVKASIKVPVTTIDHFVFEQNNPGPDIVKIDVEGAEALVLRGMKNVLKELQPLLLCEMHGRNSEVADILREAGYNAIVLGQSCELKEAPWNAQIVCHSSANPLRVTFADIRVTYV